MSLLQKASIITTPTAYAEDFLYNIKPTGGLGNELVTNGTFDTDSNWVKGTGWSIANGKASNDGSQSGTSEIYQTGVVVIGKTYKLVYDIVDYTSGTVRIRCGNTFDVTNNAIGTYTAFLTATSNAGVGIQASADFIGSIDNVSVKEVADFDFDRNSTGTRVNEDYLIEDVPYNLLSNSESFSGWSTTHATITANSETSPDGQNNATLLNDGTVSNRHGVFKTFSTGQPTHSYSFSVYLKNKDRRYAIVTLNENTGSVYYGVVVDLETGEVTQENASNVTLQSYKVSAVGNSWYRVCVTANVSYRYLTIATSNAATFTPEAYGYNNYTGENKGIYLWGAQLVKGDQPKDYLKTTDRLDIPRIDYTNGEPSILLEPQRQNVIEYSNFQDGWLLLSGGSFAYNQTISPEGIQNAPLLSGDGINGNAIYDSISLSVQSYTLSVFAKQKNVSVISLKGFSSGAAGTSKFNLSNGTIDTTSSGQFSDEKIEDYGNGWYRCSVKVTATSSGSKLFGFSAESSDSGELFYIYGAQLEAGSYATSLIHTSGSAVTRSADAANNAGNSDLINSTEGVLYLEIAALAVESSVRQLAISDGTANEAVKILYLNATQIRIELKTASGTDFVKDVTVTTNEFQKIALQYKASNYKVFLNGVAQSVTQTSAVASGLDRFNFDRGDGADDWYGKVKSLMIFKEALTDLELAKLTGYNNHELYMNYYNRLSYLGLVEEYNVESDINNYIL